MNALKITGGEFVVIVEEIEDKLMQQICY